MPRPSLHALTAWFPSAAQTPAPERAARRSFLVGLAVVGLAFAWPLAQLSWLALHSSLYSHLPLIPWLSLYVWRRRGGELRFAAVATPARPWALPAGGLAAVLLLLWLLSAVGLWGLTREQALPLAIVGLVVALGSLALAFWTTATLRPAVAPLAFLLFLVPFPPELLRLIEQGLQHGSALAAAGLFQLSSTPVHHDRLVFEVPGVSLEIAPECSGIRSSLVLLITSVFAGLLLLDRPWKIAVLAGAVLPLALLRNGFRIFVIGELCARVSPDMVYSWIHRHGGPVFFALSLVPFFALLWCLARLGRPPRHRRS